MVLLYATDSARVAAVVTGRPRPNGWEYYTTLLGPARRTRSNYVAILHINGIIWGYGRSIMCILSKGSVSLKHGAIKPVKTWWEEDNQLNSISTWSVSLISHARSLSFFCKLWRRSFSTCTFLSSRLSNTTEEYYSICMVIKKLRHSLLQL